MKNPCSRDFYPHGYKIELIERRPAASRLPQLGLGLRLVKKMGIETGGLAKKGKF